MIELQRIKYEADKPRSDFDSPYEYLQAQTILRLCKALDRCLDELGEEKRGFVNVKRHNFEIEIQKILAGDANE